MKSILRRALFGGCLAAAVLSGLNGRPGTSPTAMSAEPRVQEKKSPEAKGPAKSASSLDDELFQGLDDGTGRPKKPAIPNVKPSTPGKPAAAAKPDTTAKPDTAAKPDTTAKPDTAAKPDAAAKPAAATKPASETKPLPKPANPLDAELLKELEGDQPQKQKKPQTHPQPAPGGGKSDPDDPLARLSRRIREAESRLRRNESGEETQQLQRDITEDLEKLIAQIEQRQQQKQSQQQPGKGSPKPGQKPGEQKQPGSQQGSPDNSPKPSPDSDENLRKMADKKADPGKLKNMLEQVWGALPERQRQDVMQSSVDDFPVKYQYVIEEYFRSLLERRE